MQLNQPVFTIYLTVENKVLVVRRVGGLDKEMQFNTTEVMEVAEGFDKWNQGALIQNAFPMLDAGEREFLLTGMTPYEWRSIFGSEEENL
jgi:hypothetical protein